MTLHARKLHDPAVPIRTKDQLIDQFEAHMEETYLKYLDSAIPLHLMADGGVRSAVCKMRLMAHHPSQYKGKEMPRSERDMLFATSVQMVEYDVLGKSTRALDVFSWHLDVAFQIDALVFMLIASRTQPPDAVLACRAWHLVAEMYRHRPALLDDTRNELYAAVRALTLRAWAAREADAARCRLEPLPVPDVIVELRARKARHAARAASAIVASGPSSSSLCHPLNNNGNNNISPEASALHQLAGVATQVDTRYQQQQHENNNGGPGFVFGGIGNSNGNGANQTGSFQTDADVQCDGMFSNFTADMDVSGWAPVDWDYWNALLERNNVLQ